MWKVYTKMVPKLVNDDQNERCMAVYHSTLEGLETEPDLLGRVITGDESWIFEYDQETKHHSLQWKSQTSPSPKRTRQSKSKDKIVLIAFFDVRDIVHCKFLPQYQGIDQDVYKEIMWRLLRSLLEKEARVVGSQLVAALQ